MIEMLKSLIRCVLKYKLRKDKVIIGSNVRFNKETIWGGYNKVHRNSVVSSAVLGKYSFIGEGCYLPKVLIGKYCSIGSNVKVISETHPSKGFLSTHPVFFSTNKQCGISFTKENLFNEHLSVMTPLGEKYCEIGNDVWIGNDVRIVGGVKIGDGAIIGLGAVITKDIPPYAVVGGVPAKVIRYRYDESTIGKLMKIKWWNKDKQWILDHLAIFQKEDLKEIEKL